MVMVAIVVVVFVAVAATAVSRWRGRQWQQGRPITTVVTIPAGCLSSARWTRLDDEDEGREVEEEEEEVEERERSEDNRRRIGWLDDWSRCNREDPVD